MEGQFAGCAFAQLERLQGRRNAFRLSSALSTGDTNSVDGFVSQGWKVVDGAVVAGVNDAWNPAFGADPRAGTEGGFAVLRKADAAGVHYVVAVDLLPIDSGLLKAQTDALWQRGLRAVMHPQARLQGTPETPEEALACLLGEAAVNVVCGRPEEAMSLLEQARDALARRHAPAAADLLSGRGSIFV